ncbi:hypothetical protein [Oligella urethralis]|uniref:hypothetical protein n=1 Tax=Oligella urethralis TaxID=90245 RepID=UPI000DFB555D|nr:hypothetical protein [Oligella urethralis]SUA54882.1 Uncharacterised protein [Oligella urethralis]
MKNGLSQIAQGDENKVQYILSIPITQKIDDGRVGEACLKARQQVGVDNSMDMKLARAAEPALFLLGGTGVSTVKVTSSPQIFRNIGKSYIMDAAQSIAVGGVTSLMTEGSYTTANLFSDATVGVAFSRLVRGMHFENKHSLQKLDKLSPNIRIQVTKESNRIVKPFLQILDFSGGYFIGGGVSAGVSHYGGNKVDTKIIEVSSLKQIFNKHDNDKQLED